MNVPIIGSFLSFCLLEIHWKEQTFVCAYFFSISSILRKALRPSSGISSRAALAAESSPYIFINSSACWIITQFWQPLMQHNSKGGGGSMGSFFSSPFASSLISKYGRACCESSPVVLLFSMMILTPCYESKEKHLGHLIFCGWWHIQNKLNLFYFNIPSTLTSRQSLSLGT